MPSVEVSGTARWLGRHRAAPASPATPGPWSEAARSHSLAPPQSRAEPSLRQVCEFLVLPRTVSALRTGSARHPGAVGQLTTGGFVHSLKNHRAHSVSWRGAASNRQRATPVPVAAVPGCRWLEARIRASAVRAGCWGTAPTVSGAALDPHAACPLHHSLVLRRG